MRFDLIAAYHHVSLYKTRGALFPLAIGITFPEELQIPVDSSGFILRNAAYREHFRIALFYTTAIQLDLPVVAGKPIPVLYVEMDGTGVPVVKKETVGRPGKTDGQPAHTREVKLGCVFTQTTYDKEGFPIRDPDSTTYTGAIETAEEFGKRIYLEAYQRGWEQAAKKVVLADGAEWIWNLADLHFPGAIQIVDLYHARQHLWELARKLYPNDPVMQKAWMKKHQRRMLDKGKIEKLVLSLRSIDSNNPEVLEKIRIEAGCKTVIGSRLKQSGMFWTVPGANAIVALRCCHLNGQFEDYWEARRAA